MPSAWTTTLAAVDGSQADDVAAQVSGVPSDATHLVLSVGGNDAIVRTASSHGLDVIDLRVVLDLPQDHANPTEPSSVGRAKIARVAPVRRLIQSGSGLEFCRVRS